MTTLHVVPDERGTWRLFDDARPVAVSEHTSATEAERSAWAQARLRRARAIVVHDRYGRTRPPVRFDGPRRPPAHGGGAEEPEDVVVGLA